MAVVKDTITLTKVANGDDGRGILGTPVSTYAQSTSGTTPPTSWSATRPNVPIGQYLWTRVVTTYTDNTTSETQTPTLMGREAIVINSTAPSNPSTGTLWQTPTDPNVQKWDGTKWVNWGIAPENIIADNLVARDGKFEEIEGIKITGSEFQNPFTNEPIDGGDEVTGSKASGKATLKGKLGFDGEIDTSHEFSTEYGPVRLGGTVRLKSASPTAEPALMWWLNPYGLTLRVEGVGGTLRYQDLIKFPQRIIDNVSTGFEPYATSVGSTSTPTCERSMRSVQLSGAFKNTVAFTGEKKMATLPVGYRPSSIVSNRCQGSGNNTHYVSVYPDGSIYSDRYTAGTVPLGSWLKIDISFLAGDI